MASRKIHPLAKLDVTSNQAELFQSTPKSPFRDICTNVRADLFHKFSTNNAPGSPVGPGYYINGLERASEVKSNTKTTRTTVFHKGSARFSNAAPEPMSPGPGAYIDPMTEGRNALGESKMVVSTMRSARSITFGSPRPRGRRARGRSVDGGSSSRGDGGGGRSASNRAAWGTKSSNSPNSPTGSARRMDDAGTPGPGHYLDPHNTRAYDFLSSRPKSPQFSFGWGTGGGGAGGRGFFSPKSARSAGSVSNSSSGGRKRHNRVRPSSAPPRSRSYGGVDGRDARAYNLEGDHKVLSNFKHSGGARWGPPGR